MQVAIDSIVIDDAVYPREKLNDFHINRLKLAIEAGAKVPPIIVEAVTHRLVDGRHRYEAQRELAYSHVEVEQKTYLSDADLFADAVRLNVTHGEALDSYTVRNAIIRLTEYGFEPARIVEIVRLPPAKIEEIQRGYAYSQSNDRPIALKGGLAHMGGRRLSEQQIAVNKQYGGSKAIFYVRQIRDLLESDMWPDHSVTFRVEMDNLVALWATVRPDDAEAA